jgi:hypothetical protein
MVNQENTGSYYVRGFATGVLMNLQQSFYRRGMPPMRLAHIAFNGFDEKFIVRDMEGWERLCYCLSSKNRTATISVGVGAQYYHGKDGKSKKSLSIFSLHDDEHDAGIFIEFRGKIMEMFFSDDREYVVLDCSTRKFACYFYLANNADYSFHENG